MTRDAQGEIFKKAFRHAGHPDSGQVTHRPRHDGAVTARLQNDLGTDAPACMGDWQNSILQQIYARLPAGKELAIFAGFGLRSAYLIAEALLDPSLMPEYKGTVAAFYQDLPELLQEHKKVHTFVVLFFCCHSQFGKAILVKFVQIVRNVKSSLRGLVDMQHNQTCSKAERELAGEHWYGGTLNDALIIFRTAPFFQDASPQLMLWKCAALEPYVRNGTWDKWCQFQKRFCQVCREAEQALGHPLCASVGSHMDDRTFLATRCCSTRYELHDMCADPSQIYNA